MIEFIVIVFVLFAIIGIAFSAAVIRGILEKLHEQHVEEMQEKAIETLRETIIPSKIEEHNGLLLLYNKETNEFLAQGTTFEELEKAVHSRFPDKLFNVPSSQLDKYTNG